MPVVSLSVPHCKQELPSSCVAACGRMVLAHLDYWTIRCDHVAVLVGLDLTAAFLNDPYFDAAPRQTTLSGFLYAWAANEHLAAFIRPKP